MLLGKLADFLDRVLGSAPCNTKLICDLLRTAAVIQHLENLVVVLALKGGEVCKQIFQNQTCKDIVLGFVLAFNLNGFVFIGITLCQLFRESGLFVVKLSFNCFSQFQQLLHSGQRIKPPFPSGTRQRFSRSSALASVSSMVS